MTASTLRVLLVEDETLNRALVRAIVARSAELANVELVEAGTIGDARRVLAEGGIDILLLDVRLPDGSGLELAGELRRRRDDAGLSGRAAAPDGSTARAGSTAPDGEPTPARAAPIGASPDGAPVPRIAILSASVLANERQAALDAGADEFLGKPFAPTDLVALLGRLERQTRDGAS